MTARFELGMPLAQLLLDFFRDAIDRGVKVALAVLGEQIRAAHSEPHGASKSPLGRARMIVFQSDPDVHGSLVQMLQFIDARQHVILDGFGQGHIVRRKNEFHKSVKGLHDSNDPSIIMLVETFAAPGRAGATRH